jgi:hypothetical protein
VLRARACWSSVWQRVEGAIELAVAPPQWWCSQGCLQFWRMMGVCRRDVLLETGGTACSGNAEAVRVWLVGGLTAVLVHGQAGWTCMGLCALSGPE